MHIETIVGIVIQFGDNVFVRCFKILSYLIINYFKIYQLLNSEHERVVETCHEDGL